MFVVCGYDLVRRAHRKEARLCWPMVLAGGLLILLATIRYALNAIYVAVAFLDHDTPLSRQDYFHDVTNRMFQARHAIFVVVQLVLDSFVVCTSLIILHFLCGLIACGCIELPVLGRLAEELLDHCTPGATLLCEHR